MTFTGQKTLFAQCHYAARSRTAGQAVINRLHWGNKIFCISAIGLPGLYLPGRIDLPDTVFAGITSVSLKYQYTLILYRRV